MRKKLLAALSLIALSCIVSHSAYSQSGYLTGKIIGESDNEALPGATIRLKEANGTGTVSNIDGFFTLTNVPIGNQELIISYIGFQTMSISIEVQEGENNIGTTSLTTDAKMLDGEVVVSAQVHGQQVAIQQQLASDAIVNIVSADKIQELPDVNAAEAIARLPGVAINRSGGEGQKVVIRGMAPKFAAITLNGVRMPSNDPSDRSSDLSLISPELLSGIEVFKSPLPDMDAESTAGSVNLRLRRAPEGLRFLAKALGGYNQLNSDFGDYKGLLQLSNRVFNNNLGFVFQSSAERFNRSGSQIDYDWQFPGTTEDGFPLEILGQRYTLRQQQEIRRRINSSLSLDYNLKNGNKLAFYGLYTRTTRDRTRSNFELNYSGSEINYTSTDIENSLDLFSASLSGEHTKGKFLIDWSVSRSSTIGETPYELFSEFSQEPGTVANYPAGIEDFHPRIYLDSARFSDVERLYVNNFTDSRTKETSSTYLINIQRPFKVSSSIRLNAKAGFKYYGIDRNRSANQIGERLYGIGSGVQESVDAYNALYGEGDLVLSADGQRIRMESFIQEGFQPEVVLENEETFTIARAPDPALMERWYQAVNHLWRPNGVGFPEDNYDLNENIYAFYAMVKANIGEKLLIIPGVRFEKSDNQYSGFVSPDADNTRDGNLASIRDTTTQVNYQNFFPHLHIKYQAFDWMEVRASYASTIARPDFTRLIPRVEVRNNNNRLLAGNSGLLPMTTNNYDLSFGFFKQGLGFLSLGGFYKDIDNFFTNQTFPLAAPGDGAPFGFSDIYRGFTLSTHVNLNESRVYGFEFDIQSNLAALPSPWNGVVINLNYAKLYSKTKLFFLETTTRFVGTLPVSESVVRERSVGLISQAPGILRASLGYDYEGFSFRVSAAYQATKVRGYTLGVQEYDRYDLEFWRVDAVVKQKFGERWSAFLNLNNLTDQQDIITRARTDRTYIDEIETFGPTYQLGVQYSLR